MYTMAEDRRRERVAKTLEAEIEMMIRKAERTKLKRYDIWFVKPSGTDRVQKWERFAENKEQARESALRALDGEYYGKAELLDVVERTDL